MKDIEKIIEIIEENEVMYKGLNEARLHSAEDIVDYFKNKSAIKQVELFQRTFGDIVANLGEIPSVEKRKLRLKLIFEELSELAEAYGLEATMVDICQGYVSDAYDCVTHKIGVTRYPKDTELFNPEEALDAVCDLLVVTYGGACINGHSTIIDKAFDETMRSNMSKICNTLDEAHASVAKYHKEGIDTEPVKTGENQWTIYNKITRKILKGVNFFKPDYKKLLNL